MANPPDKSEAQLHPDEINRLRQHAIHEERLFHDRMNFFFAMKVGLLGVFAILYHKEPSPGVFIPLTAVALAFTLLWLVVQVRALALLRSRQRPGSSGSCRSTGGRWRPSPPRDERTGCQSPAPWRTPCPCCSRRPGYLYWPGCSFGPVGESRPGNDLGQGEGRRVRVLSPVSVDTKTDRPDDRPPDAPSRPAGLPDRTRQAPIAAQHADPGRRNILHENGLGRGISRKFQGEMEQPFRWRGGASKACKIVAHAPISDSIL